MQNKGILMVISGFSGAGKGTLVKKLLSEYDNYALSISMTTRGPREGEQDGREYFFRTREQFEENIAKNGFIEYAQYCGNYYGTPKAYVEEQMQAGKDVILEIEIQGALKNERKAEIEKAGVDENAITSADEREVAVQSKPSATRVPSSFVSSS